MKIAQISIPSRALLLRRSLLNLQLFLGEIILADCSLCSSAVAKTASPDGSVTRSPSQSPEPTRFLFRLLSVPLDSTSRMRPLWKTNATPSTSSAAIASLQACDSAPKPFTVRAFPQSPSSTFQRFVSGRTNVSTRSEEHTSELQSRFDLVC